MSMFTFWHFQIKRGFVLRLTIGSFFICVVNNTNQSPNALKTAPIAVKSRDDTLYCNRLKDIIILGLMQLTSWALFEDTLVARHGKAVRPLGWVRACHWWVDVTSRHLADRWEGGERCCIDPEGKPWVDPSPAVSCHITHKSRCCQVDHVGEDVDTCRVLASRLC